jgi:hypothetical protein
MKRAVLAVTIAASSSNAFAEPNNCTQASFLFSKLAVAAVNCNFPDSPEINKPLAVFADVARHYCGNGPASRWPGTKVGGMAFYKEVRSKGRGAVCGRIYGEFLGARPSR